MANQTFVTTIENAEVRCVKEIKKSFCHPLTGNPVNYEHLEIGFDDENGNRLTFIDRDMSRKELYKRGTTGTIKLKVITETAVGQAKDGVPYTYEKTKYEINDFISN